MMFAATSFPKPLPIIKPSSPLQSSLQWNPTFSPFSMQFPPFSLTENRLKLIRNSNLYQKHSIYTLKSVSNPRTCTTTLDFEDECRSRSGLMDEILKLLKTLQIPAIVAIVLGLLFMCNPHAALSATGGRMGGGSFSSSSSSSSRSSSSSSGSRSSSSSSGSRSSSSSPSRSSSSSSSSRSSSGSSYSSSSSPSYSSSSSSPSYSYSSPSSHSSSYSSPSKSKSSVKSPSYSSTSPNPSSSEESPSYWSSSSVVKQSSSSTSPRPSSSATSASKSKSSSSASESDSSMKGILFICFCASIAYIWITTLLSPKTSVIKIQVCLLGTAKLLQKDLDAVAGVADTSTSKGWSYILKESALALLRYPHYCISAHSIVYLETKNTECMTNIETLFNRLSIEEREKFDEETLVNVNNIKRKGTMRKPKSDISNEYIVVTILVAAHGKYKFPRVIKTRENLKEALQILGSIPTEETLAVEVLWTPQDENDALSEQELHENYPLLIVLPQ